ICTMNVHPVMPSTTALMVSTRFCGVRSSAACDGVSGSSIWIQSQPAATSFSMSARMAGTSASAHSRRGRDGGGEGGAVRGGEVELGRDAVRAGHADLRAAARACPEELVLSGVVPDRLDLVERLDHLVDREHVPADRAELARRGLERQAGHLPCDALDPAAPAVLAVGEDVQARRLLIVDGQLAVVVEQLLAVGGDEAAFPLGIREDVEPAR